MEEIKRYLWIAYLWVMLWWIVNVKRRTPSDFHRALTTMGYRCDTFEMEHDKYTRVYKSEEGETITISFRRVNGEN